MRKVYTSDSVITIAHLRNVLEAEGIACLIRNQHLAGAMGEIPATECWPQLWVVNNSDQLRAQSLIGEELAREQRPVQDWKCPKCGESIEGQFDACWLCGTLRG